MLFISIYTFLFRYYTIVLLGKILGNLQTESEGECHGNKPVHQKAFFRKYNYAVILPALSGIVPGNRRSGKGGFYCGSFDFGFGNINDIFESFFGGMGGFGGGHSVDPNAPQRGHDLRLDIELEFEEAAFGVEKEIKIDHLEMCKDCYGTGAEPGTKPSICPDCDGKGRVAHVTRTILGSIQQVTVCPRCGGTGQIIGSPCKKCNGEGRKEVEKTIKVKIPAGVDNNAKIRVSKEGDAGKNGGSSGDLYVVLHVKPHYKFKRDGFNVYSEINVSLPQSVLGDNVVVDTIHGEKDLSIPAGLEYGKILTIKNCGIPFLGHPEKRGDHFVVVKYSAPKSINDEEKRLYRKLFEISENKNPNERLIDKFKNAIHN